MTQQSPGNPYVRFKDVNKVFGRDTHVIKNLCLDIYNGEFLTILGSSGSGKTTCLMMLAGFEDVSSGTIEIDNQRVNAIPPYQRDIGLVFQDYALFPHMTVFDNLAFPLRARKYKSDAIAQKVQEMLAMVELEGFAKRFPGQLSGGQQQRVALARALIFQPKLVLMDEPLGALDKQLKDQMRYEIKRLHSELGFTAIYITHDQSEALVLSDRIAVFDQGEIQQIDVPDALYEYPSNAFTASFMGENNILPGKLLQIYGDTCAVEVAGGHRLQGTPIELSADHKAVTVAIRPERILLNPGNDCLNIINSRVKEFVYLGDYMRVVVSIADQTTLAIKTPNDRGKWDFAIGEDIKIGWYPEDCWVFKTQ